MRSAALPESRRVGILLTGLCLLLASCAPNQAVRKAMETGGLKEVAERRTPDTEVKMADASPVKVPTAGPIRINVKDAILMALQNNRSLVVDRLTPEIQQTFEEQQQAVFDPIIGSTISAQRIDSKLQAGSGTQSIRSESFDGSISLSEFLPSGTLVSLDATTGGTDSTLTPSTFYSTGLGLSLTQALLRGYGADVNLVRLRQARLDTDISLYELRGFIQTLVANVEFSYWDYGLAQRQIEIVEESLKLARQQLYETREMIKVGKLAEAEVAAVQAEVALQEQGLINARSNLESTRLSLLRLLNPPGKDLWGRKIQLLLAPSIPEIKLGDVGRFVGEALRMRPEINQARLEIERGDLEIVRTRNGLLPRLDFFVSLGKTGYSNSFSGSVGDIGGDGYQVLGSLTLQYPLLNRDADAQYRRSLVSRDQAEKALSNLSQLAELDVQNAYIEVGRSRDQISASQATREYQEETLRVETEKFRVGRSTSLLVSQAQRDFLQARINEVQAIANYLKALVSLYLQEGTLLERLGISAPGSEPVERLSESGK